MFDVPQNRNEIVEFHLKYLATFNIWCEIIILNREIFMRKPENFLATKSYDLCVCVWRCGVTNVHRLKATLAKWILSFH